MPDLYTDDNGNRVIDRNRGPAGPGVPAGGTTGQIYRKASNDDYDGEWAAPPTVIDAVLFAGAAPADGEFALYDGITGKLIKASGMTLTILASTFANKVDKSGTKVLSDVNYTAAEAAKLAGIDPEHFLGVFATLAALEAAHATASAGDHASVEATGSDLELYAWDATNTVWSRVGEPFALTGSDVADILFTAPAEWDVDDCQVFTAAEKIRVANSVQAADLIASGIGVAAYGGLYFFSLTAPVTPTISVVTSDGLDNMVKIDPVTSMNTSSTNFDNGGSNDGRLRYTGTDSRNFFVVATLSVANAALEPLVFAIAKQGVVEPSSRVQCVMTSATDVALVTVTALVTLTANQYVEVVVGNTTNLVSADIYSMSISATKM